MVEHLISRTTSSGAGALIVEKHSWWSEAHLLEAVPASIVETGIMTSILASGIA